MNRAIERERISKKKQQENLQKSFEMLSIEEKLQYIDKMNICEGIYRQNFTKKRKLEARLKAEKILQKGNERRIHRELWEQKKFLSI